MNGKKQSRTDLLEKKVQALINVVQQLLNETAYLKDLAVGTLETIKQMPGYEEAIEKLKVQMAGNASQIKEEEIKPIADHELLSWGNKNM